MKVTLLRTTVFSVVSAATLVFSGCHSGDSGMKGTYTDPAGAVLLELRSGGKANFTFMGDVEDCTYSTSHPHLNLNCKGSLGKVVLTIHDDGSLTGPPGSFMPGLRKEK